MEYRVAPAISGKMGEAALAQQFLTFPDLYAESKDRETALNGGENAGESRAERWKPADPGDEVIPRIVIASTRRYVSRIMKRYRNYLEKIQ